MDEKTPNELQRWMLTMNNNKIKIPVARLKQIIQEEVSRFYGLENELDEEMDDQEEIEEAVVTGATESDKQAAIQAVTNSMKAASADKAVASAVGAGVSVPNIKAIR
jgi:hypothetical protein